MRIIKSSRYTITNLGNVEDHLREYRGTVINYSNGTKECWFHPAMADSWLTDIILPTHRDQINNVPIMLIEFPSKGNIVNGPLDSGTVLELVGPRLERVNSSLFLLQDTGWIFYPNSQTVHGLRSILREMAND